MKNEKMEINKKKNQKRNLFGIILLLFGILIFGCLIDFVSADDTLKTVNGDGTITISSCTGGIFTGNTCIGGVKKDVVNMKLNTPHNYNVIRGKDRLVAEFYIDELVDYTSDAINNMEFYNMKGNSSFSRPFTYKFKTYESYMVNVPDKTEKVCFANITADGGQTCYDNVTSYIKEERQNVIWNKLVGKTLPKGNITIGIFTDVYPNENIEWIPTLFGMKINEWASWNETFVSGLRNYYPLDTNLSDSFGYGFNMTNYSATNFSSGLNGNAISISAGSKLALTSPVIIGMFNGTLTSGSFSFWFYDSAFSDNTYILNYGYGYMTYKVSGNRFFYGDFLCNNVNSMNNSWNSSSWNMVTFSKNSSATTGYVNGQWACQGTGTQATSSDFYMPKSTSIASLIRYDELLIYNRTLSPSEVRDLYNAGNGIFYGSSSLRLDVDFISQSPSDINSGNVVANPLNVSYGIVSSVGLNLSSVLLFFKSNSTTRNSIVFINGTAIPEWNNISYFSNLSSNFSWNLSDNDIYPSTNNFNDDIFEYSPYVLNQLTSTSQYVSIQLLNVTNTTQYNFFEIMSNSTSVQNIYYCNSSYPFSNPSTDNSCGAISQIPANQSYNHTHSIYSSHQVVPFIINTTTGKTNANVIVTPKSYFILRGNFAIVNYYSIVNLSRIGVISTSINNGGTWTNQTYTVNAHLHQFSGNSSFYYYVCANDTMNNVNCSSVRQDLFELGGLSPTSPNVYSPNSSFYKSNFSINYTASISPNNYPIIQYNISLLNLDFSFNRTIIGNNSNNIGYIWNITGVPDGNYIISVKAYDNLSQTSIGYSENFTIDRIFPAISILFPLNQNYTISPNSLNYTFSEINPDLCWYSLDNGRVNVTVDCGKNVTILFVQQNWNNWTFWARDKANNINFSSISFFLDSVLPNADLISPLNYTFSKNIQNFTVNLSDNKNKYSLCYQESAIAINQTGIDGICQLYYNGNYTFDNSLGSFVNANNLFDGNWTSGGFVSDTFDSSLYINYTTPDYLSNAVWRVSNSIGGGIEEFNISIPNDCISDNLLMVKVSVIRSTGTAIKYYCKNITDWKTLNTVSSEATVYEEAMIWNVSSQSGSGIFNTTLNIYNLTSGTIINQTNSNFSSGIFNYVLGIPVNLSDGIYNWFYEIFDKSGNKNFSSNYTLTIDTIYPLIDYGIGTPDNNSALDSTDIFINVTWIEANPVNITFRVNDTYQTFTNLTYSYTFSGLSIGYHNFDVTVCDQVNQCNTTIARQILLNTGNPNVQQGTSIGGSFTIMPNNTILNSSSTNNFTVNATDSFGIVNVTINITDSNGTVVGFINQSYSGNIMDVILGLPLTLVNGVYRFFVSAYNSVGNVIESIITFTMDYDGIYPIFYSYTSVPSGSDVVFSVNVNNTNGTVFLNINGTSYNAMNLTTNRYFVSITGLLNDTNYYYNWTSFGNGIHNNSNVSNILLFVQSTSLPPVIPINSTGIQEYFISSQYPYVELNTTVDIIFQILSNLTPVSDTDVSILIDGHKYNFTAQPTFFNITLLFNTTGDYPFTVFMSNSSYANFSSSFFVRSSYNITICGFNDKSGTSYRNNFAYLVAEYTPSKYNADLDQFITPLQYASTSVPVFHTAYSSGCGTLKLYEPNRDYTLRLFDGVATFPTVYSVPNITKTYGTNILLGKYKFNGTSENLNVYLSPKDINPYFWIFNWILIISIIGVLIISVFLFFVLSSRPTFALIFFIMGIIGLVILRIVVYIWIG